MRPLRRDDDLNIPIFQLSGERERLTVTGVRCDNGQRCTLLLVADAGGSFALYPHGADEFGVRIALPDAQSIAEAILTIAGSAPGRETP